MPLYVKVAGAWDQLDFTGVKFKQAGAWSVADALYFKNAGIWREVWKANGPPPDPQSVVASASNGGNATISWSYPSNIENDYAAARVEVSVASNAFGSMNETTYPNASQSRTGLSQGTTYKYRVATRDSAGLLSNWVESNTITGINSGPGAASVYNFAWNGQGFTVYWYDPANPYGDITDVDVYAKQSAGGYVKIGDFGYAGGARSAVVTNLAWDNYHSVFVRVISPGGTTDSNIMSAWSPPQPGTAKTIYPVATDTWAQTGGWRHTPYLFQGYNNSTYAKQAGYLFYGTQWQDACHGFTPNIVVINMKRNGSSGNFGRLDYNFHGYTTTTTADPPSLFSPTYGGWNEYSPDEEWEDPVPTEYFQAMIDGTYKGFLIWKDSTSTSYYRNMHGPTTYAQAGRMRFGF